jgi:hypothetical protein
MQCTHLQIRLVGLCDVVMEIAISYTSHIFPEGLQLALD